MTLKIPAGFELPEGVGEGDEFEATVTLKLNEDATVAEVTALDGVPLEKEEEESKDDEEGEGAEGTPDENNEELDFQSAVMAGLNTNG